MGPEDAGEKDDQYTLPVEPREGESFDAAADRAIQGAPFHATAWIHDHKRGVVYAALSPAEKRMIELTAEAERARFGLRARILSADLEARQSARQQMAAVRAPLIEALLQRTSAAVDRIKQLQGERHGAEILGSDSKE